MAFDFPASPVNGDEFTPLPGLTYIFGNGAWRFKPPATPMTLAITVDTVPPGAPLPNQFWWETDTGNLYIWYDDGDSQQWVQINGPQVFASPARIRNRIVNGAMQVSQEWGNSVIGNGFPADQWQGAYVGGAQTHQRLFSTTPKGNNYRISAVVTTIDAAPAAGDFAGWFYNIEGEQIPDSLFGSVAARSVIVRFGFRGPAGTYAFALRNNATSRSYVSTFVVTAGQANTDVEFILRIPGDITGTWLKDIGRGMTLSWCWMAGATWQTPTLNAWVAGGYFSHASVSNGLAALSNTFQIMDAALYIDFNNTGIEPQYEVPNIANELLTCMRYWQQVQLYWCGITVSGNGYYACVNLPVIPRNGASVTLTGTNLGAGGFPTAVGPLAMVGVQGVRETRTANAAGNASLFSTTITANARL